MAPQETLPFPDLLYSTAVDRSTIQVTGEDRQSWLNGLVTCNLAPLQPGQGAYGLATSKVGKILADLDIVILPERILLSCPSSQSTALLTSFERYLVMEDVELQDVSDRYTWFFLHGARSAEAARLLEKEHGGTIVDLDRTGLHDIAWVMAADRGEQALAGIRRIAVPLTEYDWLRIQEGAPVFGIDFNDNHYPQEASLEKRAVSFCKGCYLGQEVICRLEMRGHVHRRLAVLHIEGNELPTHGAPVLVEGMEVGNLTSASWSPQHQKTLALALLKFASSSPGTLLEVNGRKAIVTQAGTKS